MGLEKVKEKVKQEAELEAGSRVQAAREEAQAIVSATAKQARQKEAEYIERLQQDIELIKKREQAATKLEMKKLELQSRKQLVDSIFQEASGKLEKLPDAERAKHIKALLTKASSEIDIARIYCSKKDLKHAAKYKTAETNILGGLIAESTDGMLRVDYSYETLLTQLRESTLPELDRILFTQK
ncbi:hypothetical protein HYX10_05195 [Candidatus Woesearchaeota archaeon]|nr:hypothetical protein [Candidatus Woesearchaeota archaeon]